MIAGRHHPAGGLVGPPRPDLPLLKQGQLLSPEKFLGHPRRPRTCGEGDQSDSVHGDQRQGPQAMHSSRDDGTGHRLPMSARYETLPACPCGLGRVFCGPQGKSRTRRKPPLQLHPPQGKNKKTTYRRPQNKSCKAALPLRRQNEPHIDSAENHDHHTQ